MNYKKYIITDEIITWANIEKEKIPEDINESIKDGEGRFEGVMGELVAKTEYKGIRENTYHYDIILPDGRTADAKTKLIKKDIIQPWYDCSVYAKGKFQKCDVYIFLRYFHEGRRMYVLGSITKDDFYRKAIFRKKGEVDPKSPIGWRYKKDCYNIEIGDLIPVGDEI